jgi:2'-5' RNA ligase
LRYFLAISPPPELEQAVLIFRSDWKLDGIAPHITVKAPCGLGDAQEWLPTVQQYCQQLTPPSIRVGGIGLFGSAILYLHVYSPQIIAIHRRLLTLLATSTFDQEECFEGVKYVPHLTLAYLSQVDGQQREEVIRAAKSGFAEVTGFRATALSVYGKDGHEPYRMISSIPCSSF